MKRASRWGKLLFAFLVLVTFSDSLSGQQYKRTDLILDAIKASGAQWTPKDTRVSRLSLEQLRLMLGDRSREVSGGEPISERTVDSYPASIDWRDKDGLNYVTSVKDQGDCGSCVAFDAVAVPLESLICIEQARPGEDVDLSEMNLFMCGCGLCCGLGWTNSQACSYMRWSGVPDEHCWPYEPEDSECSNSCSNKALRDVQIDSSGFILGGEAYKTAITFSPILTTMQIYDDFLSYGGGIYQHVWGEYRGMHSVCVIGYNTEGQTPYWIIKNSWGTDWGEDGFGKIKMGECAFEAGGYYISGASLPQIPNVPSDMSTSDNPNAYVNLDWDDDSNNEMAFDLQRRIGEGEFSSIAEVPANTTSYMDAEALPETEYSYRISANNIAGSSGYSNIASLVTPPWPPSLLAAISVSEAGVTLEWQDNSSMEDGYEVWKKAGGGSWALYSTVGPGINSKEVINLAEYTQYFFKVRAFNDNGSSAWSNEISVTTLLKAPSGLVATANASDSIYLSWTDNSSKEDGFEIWEQQEGENWELKSTLGANSYVTEITGLSPGIYYCYKIIAYKADDHSAWSNASCATTQSGVPAAPSGLELVGYCWEVQLTWIDNANNEGGFHIYRQSGSAYFLIGSVGPNITTYWDTDLACGQRWCYRVRAYNQNGNSPACLGICVRTSPCYECQGGLRLSFMPDRASAQAGDAVTFTYRIENTSEVDITDVKIVDSSLGVILSSGVLRKGGTMEVVRRASLSQTFTSTAEATGRYVTPRGETGTAIAHAIATVTVK